MKPAVKQVNIMSSDLCYIIQSFQQKRSLNISNRNHDSEFCLQSSSLDRNEPRKQVRLSILSQSYHFHVSALPENPARHIKHLAIIQFCQEDTNNNLRHLLPFKPFPKPCTCSPSAPTSHGLQFQTSLPNTAPS